MGRGDKRTEKGKRARGSFGNARNKSGLKARAVAAKVSPKKEDEATDASE
jgi:ribosomal small subunit protein bTHX